MKNRFNYWFFLVSLFIIGSSFLIACLGYSQPRIEEAKRIIKYTEELIQNRDLNHVRIFALFSEESEPKRIFTLDTLDEINYNLIYNVVIKDSKVAALISVPFIESGDYKVVISHYFDRDGATIAYKKKITFLDSVCSEEPIVSVMIIYFDKKEESILKSEELTDIKGNSIDKAGKCILNFSYPDEIFPNYAQIPYSEKLARDR